LPVVHWSPGAAHERDAVSSSPSTSVSSPFAATVGWPSGSEVVRGAELEARDHDVPRAVRGREGRVGVRSVAEVLVADLEEVVSTSPSAA
jgi:hypothetical protein